MVTLPELGQSKARSQELLWASHMTAGAPYHASLQLSIFHVQSILLKLTYTKMQCESCMETFKLQLYPKVEALIKVSLSGYEFSF